MRETQLGLPFTLDDCGGMDAVYVDQAPSYGFVFSCYTPAGIKGLDGQFIRRIRMVNPRHADKVAVLREDIIHNPHLHWVIKHNLLFNLEQLVQA